MDRIRQFLKTAGGRIVAVILFVVAIGIAVYGYRGATEDSDFVAWSNDRIFVCAETGKPFPHTVKIGETIPVASPHSGKATGYPAEYCHWTADGKPKAEPTAVLLNSTLGKPEPTFCPDCGRLVVQLNPAPIAGGKPPPKESEMRKGAAPVFVGEQNRGD